MRSGCPTSRIFCETWGIHEHHPRLFSRSKPVHHPRAEPQIVLMIVHAITKSSKKIIHLRRPHRPVPRQPNVQPASSRQCERICRLGNAEAHKSQIPIRVRPTQQNLCERCKESSQPPRISRPGQVRSDGKPRRGSIDVRSMHAPYFTRKAHPVREVESEPPCPTVHRKTSAAARRGVGMHEAVIRANFHSLPAASALGRHSGSASQNPAAHCQHHRCANHLSHVRFSSPHLHPSSFHCTTTVTVVEACSAPLVPVIVTT